MPLQLGHAHTDVGDSFVSEVTFRNWLPGEAAVGEAVSTKQGTVRSDFSPYPAAALRPAIYPHVRQGPKVVPAPTPFEPKQLAMTLPAA